MRTTNALNPYVRAMSMPVWLDDAPEVPEDIEIRKEGDLAVLVVRGTRMVLGFVPSRVDDLAPLIARLRQQGE